MSKFLITLPEEISNLNLEKLNQNNMKTKSKIKVLQYFFILFNVVFLILGLLLMGCGLWMLLDQKNITKLLVSADAINSLASGIAYSLLSAGAIVVLLCFLGSVGALQQVRCLLKLYSGFLILVFTAAVIIEMLLLLFFHQELVLKALIGKIHKVIFQYGKKKFFGNKNEWEIMDSIQQNSKCCGMHNYTDWLQGKNWTYPYRLPCSCSNSSGQGWFCELSQSAIHDSGCENMITEWYHSSIYTMTGLLFGLMIIEILQITMAIILIKNINKFCKVAPAV
ncbi:hypothetical protein FKM82_025517 [Ascaphus truei]